jgi:hypothetical protein
MTSSHLSDQQIGARLRQHFRNAVKQAKHHKRKIFLELYAGTGRTGAAVRRSGFGCLSFEIKQGPEFDLTRLCVHKRILGWIASGCIAGVVLETQCSSWSRARRGPPGSSWCAIRSNEYLLGLPNLNVSDKQRVLNGNRQALYTCQIIQSCCKYGIPCALENPRTSMLWSYPRLAKLCKLSYAQIHQLDQCQYGAAWRKATSIVTWHCGHALCLDRRCKGHKHICSRTLKPHIILSGVCKERNILWTSLAQEYPKCLASHIAQCVTNGFLSLRGASLSRILASDSSS